MIKSKSFLNKCAIAAFSEPFYRKVDAPNSTHQSSGLSRNHHFEINWHGELFSSSASAAMCRVLICKR